MSVNRRATGVLAFLLVVALLLVFVADRIGDRTRIAEQGRSVLMPIVRPGPRALSLGDRIELVYDVPDLEDLLRAGHGPEQGAAVFALDGSNVARFVRWHQGGTLADGEIVLAYQFTEAAFGLLPSGRPTLTFGDEFFVVTQGRAADYRDARYAVLRVDAEGDSVITGLADGGTRPILPGR